MPLQLTISFDTHSAENNGLSQKHLDENKENFSDDCFAVLKELTSGRELTVRNAVLSGLTNSLPRRIKDLRDHNGICISDEWVYDSNGKKSHMKWYMTQDDKAKSLQVIMNKATEI